MNTRSSPRRAPASYALALVIVLTAIGVLLRWWGPMNPSIRLVVATESASASGSAPMELNTDWGVDGKAQVNLSFFNGSHSSTSIKRIRVVRSPESPELPLPSLELRVESTDLDPRQSLDVDVTLVAGKECAAWIAELPDATGRIPSSAFSLVADIRTTSGRIKSVGQNIWLQDICPTAAFLPSPGAQPPDAAAQKRAVTSAFWVAYDSSKSFAERAAMIDDVTGIPGAAVPSGVRSQVHDIVFTSPTTAAVIYDVYLDGSPWVLGRLGEAREVGGTWRVTRVTICADLDLAGIGCA